MITRIIAHRGNLEGSDPLLENSAVFIAKACSLGFDVEVDVWCVDDLLFLGHDEPRSRVLPSFLKQYADSLWCHAKNLDALTALREMGNMNYFWHETDQYTITSKGYIWAYVGNIGDCHTVHVVLDGKVDQEPVSPYFAICTDWPKRVKETLKNG